MPGLPESNPDVSVLGQDFWQWRAATQPSSGDDIPRIARPDGWLPDWSPEAIAARRTELEAFRTRWHALAQDVAGWSVPLQVDYRLLGSALARVRWELDTLQGWRRNPRFYVYQTLGAVFEALLDPAPIDAARRKTIQDRLDRIPATLESARTNLDAPIRPFAQLAIDALDDIEARLGVVGEALTLDTARAKTELARYAEWLRARLGTMPTETAIGRAAYVNFLRQVALNPRSPEQIASAGQQELDRAVSFEVFERNRNRGLPELPLPATLAEQIEREAAGETMLRQFCEEHDLLSFPAWLGRYRNLPLPSIPRAAAHTRRHRRPAPWRRRHLATSPSRRLTCPTSTWPWRAIRAR